jgi:hypothetical protein
MKSKRIAKILGVGLSVGLVFALIGAVFAAPAAAGQMKWTTVNTPDWGDNVIAPGTDILDYDIMSGPDGDGSVIYAVLEVGCFTDGGIGDLTYDDACVGNIDCLFDYRLVKSDDGGVTWSDITANVFGAASIPSCIGEAFDELYFVSVAQDDEDWLAVLGRTTLNNLWVVASKDGGSNFTFAGQVADPTGDTLLYAFDIDVSMEIDDIHNIAVAGTDDSSDAGTWTGAVFRLKAGTWLTGSWEDTGAWAAAGPPITTDYLGWDQTVDSVIDVEFSPNFDMDDTIVCLGCNDFRSAVGENVILQCGMWDGTGGRWNDEAGFPASKLIKADGEDIITSSYSRLMGIALPDDFDGTDPGQRSIFIYVDGLLATSMIIGGWVIRSDNYALSPVCGPSGDPLLASMDVHGDADTGKLMIGEFAVWDADAPEDLGGWGLGAPDDVFWDEVADAAIPYCGGVNVWHTEELDFCCPQWDGCCKNPSGPYMALVMYTPDGATEYATTSGSFSFDQVTGGSIDGDMVDDLHTIAGIDATMFKYVLGTPLDESAFSVSRDDAVSFNQLGLIDTDIDYISDVAPCPDCGTVYISTVNDGNEVCVVCTEEYSDCDSIWRSYDDGATWERVFHGAWEDAALADTQLLLRLPCDAVEDCCDQDAVAPSGTVYMGIQGNDEIFYSRDCGQCWNNPPATKDNIQDFCVESENIVHVLFSNGKVSSSTQYGRRWSTPVQTKATGGGHSITCCCEQGFLVVGGNTGGKVAWSDDGGESWSQTDKLPAAAAGTVHVACAPDCENIIYAAVNGEGIYRGDLTDGSWESLDALPYSYTGVVVAREGTLYASTAVISTVAAVTSAGYVFTDCKGRFMADDAAAAAQYSGVARNLTPCDTACCGTEDWDYLFCGMTDQITPVAPDDGQDFHRQPSALRICGCLSEDTNSVLWAIDVDHYEMAAVCDGGPPARNYPDGALWYYEDCAAKKGPELTTPEDGARLDCEACAGCDSAPFTLEWERICIACSYDIKIMDDEGNVIASWVDLDVTGDPPELYVDIGLECGQTYTWKVREANTSCECVHSPWSETWSFTIAVGGADAISLLAPDEGAQGIPIEDVGFSWSGVSDTTSYSFVLSPNPDLSDALESDNVSGTAFSYEGPLDYGTSYYWQVKAWKSGVLLSASVIGVFKTMAEPVEPPPPVEVTTTPAPVLEIPPAEQITPTWIYAIIGIGAALAVVVIVLIVRTRRP